MDANLCSKPLGRIGRPGLRLGPVRVASTTRWEIIKPVIDIHFLQSILQDEGFQKWYWTQRSDYEYAMLAMNYASQNYPPNEQELLYPTLQVGRAIAKDWG